MIKVEGFISSQIEVGFSNFPTEDHEKHSVNGWVQR